MVPVEHSKELAMNRTIASIVLLGLAFALTAPTDDASAAGTAAAGTLKATADQAAAAEGITPVHYWTYRRYYRPYYGYYRPSYRFHRPYYGYYGHARPYYGWGYRYRHW
jgi:hypothetical protein